MLLQTNSYIVPRDKRMEHARLLRRFRQTLMRLGCDHFEVYEQVGANWNTGETTGRFVQIMRFRDRKHQLSVQGAERTDPVAQALVREFCELINFPYQQQQGLFAVGFYTGFLRMPPQRTTTATEIEGGQAAETAGEIRPEAEATAESSEQFVGESHDGESPVSESQGGEESVVETTGETVEEKSGEPAEAAPMSMVGEAEATTEYAPVDLDARAAGEEAMVDEGVDFNEETPADEAVIAAQENHQADEVSAAPELPAPEVIDEPIAPVVARAQELSVADYITDDSETEFMIVSEGETEAGADEASGVLAPGGDLSDAAGEDAMSSEELRMAAEALFGPAGDDSNGEVEAGAHAGDNGHVKVGEEKGVQRQEAAKVRK